MSQTGYLILAISILVALLATFIISFIIYKRTPVPAGCEDIKISEENCGACQRKDCSLRKNKEEDK